MAKFLRFGEGKALRPTVVCMSGKLFNTSLPRLVHPLASACKQSFATPSSGVGSGIVDAKTVQWTVFSESPEKLCFEGAATAR